MLRTPARAAEDAEGHLIVRGRRAYNHLGRSRTTYTSAKTRGCKTTGKGAAWGSLPTGVPSREPHHSSFLCSAGRLTPSEPQVPWGGSHEIFPAGRSFTLYSENRV